MSRRAEHLLGAALLGQQKIADAEPLLVQGFGGMKQREQKISAAGKANLTSALERLVQLYDVWGMPEKATEWRRKLEAQRGKHEK